MLCLSAVANRKPSPNGMFSFNAKSTPSGEGGSVVMVARANEIFRNRELLGLTL